MKRKGIAQFHISGLMALVMLAVFAISILSVLLTGADTYRRLTELSSENHAQRVAEQYIATRLRQGTGLYTEDFDGTDALVFPEEVEGKTYITRIYCHDGWLRELYTAENGEFSPADGEKLLEMDEMCIIIEDNLVKVQLSLPGGVETAVLGNIREGAYEE